MNKIKTLLENFGPSLLILALGIGSGELILWPFLTANHGFGILWGAIFGITLQLFLINIISRNTLILKENILTSFSKVFSLSFLWITFSTLFAFGWPGFSSLSSELLVKGFHFDEALITPVSIFILILSGLILILSKNSYKKVLFLEKVLMSLMFVLTIFLFIFYFDFNLFKEMLAGFFGQGNDYSFIPKNTDFSIFLATFLGAIVYAGSGGNLLLLNSFYLEKENQFKKITNIKKIFKQNLIFFWAGGLFLISMLSYVSYAVLKNTENLNDDFNFLILESEIFSKDISPFIGGLFIFLSVCALIGVQIGIFDFIGRIFIKTKNFYESKKNITKISDKKIYNISIIFLVALGLLVYFFGLNKPKSLILIGAIINSFSMGAMAILLFLMEIKLMPKKNKVIIYSLFTTSLFYFSFFIFVVLEKLNIF